ncbi:MAG: hypothetical protein FJ295_01810 [Planctomycetes bacterium]|nr:hypothetical protein [Planctomycetota bacterium]
MLAGTALLLLARPELAQTLRPFPATLIVGVTLIMAQGYLHQVVLIRRTGMTGGVSLRFHQFFLAKDISTIAFAQAMGTQSGWPLLLLSVVSGATKLITMSHFRWVRLSPAAERRRLSCKARAPNAMPLD